jgi:hypothetical protein
VHGAGLQFEQALSGLSAPAEDERLAGGRLVAEAVKAVEDDLVAALPLSEVVWAGPDRLLEQGTGALIELDPLPWLDGERGEGDLGGNGRIGGAQSELEGQLVDGLERLNAAALCV